LSNGEFLLTGLFFIPYNQQLKFFTRRIIMQEVTKYPSGTFSWIDVNTTDQDAGKAFYTELFGWGSVDNPVPDGGVYTMLQLNGRDVAAISAMSPEMRESGMPPMWNSYITVEDVDKAASRAEEAGGSVMMPPFDVMNAGRMAMVQDPTGALFALWEAKEHIGAQLVNVPGSLCWNELYTNDPDKAAEFYQAVFGWEHQYDEKMNYHLFFNGERMAAGMMKISDEMAEVPPNWSIYLAVDDCDATVAKANELGGSVVVPPQDIPGTGRFAVLHDPQGAVFSVIKMEQMDPPPSA
jgi:predicted enzyme related to lactoylglutathione lyase